MSISPKQTSQMEINIRNLYISECDLDISKKLSDNDIDNFAQYLLGINSLDSETTPTQKMAIFTFEVYLWFILFICIFTGFYFIFKAENRTKFQGVKWWRFGYAHILARFSLIFGVYIQFKSLFKSKNFCRWESEHEAL